MWGSGLLLIMLIAANGWGEASNDAVVISLNNDQEIVVTFRALVVAPRSGRTATPYLLRLRCGERALSYNFDDEPTQVSLHKVSGQVRFPDVKSAVIEVELEPKRGEPCPALFEGAETAVPERNGVRRFVLETDVVHDTETGLTWVRRHHLPIRQVDWFEARDLCQGLTLVEYEDSWRLPTVAEIERLAGSLVGAGDAAAKLVTTRVWTTSIHQPPSRLREPEGTLSDYPKAQVNRLTASVGNVACVRGGSISAESARELAQMRRPGAPLDPNTPTGEVVVTVSGRYGWYNVKFAIDDRAFEFKENKGRRADAIRLVLAVGEHELRYLTQFELEPIVFSVWPRERTRIHFDADSVSLLDTKVFVNGDLVSRTHIRVRR